MLLARPAINPEVQGTKLAVDIFSFVTNFFSQHVGVPKAQLTLNLHVGQIHLLVFNKIHTYVSTNQQIAGLRQVMVLTIKLK